MDNTNSAAPEHPLDEASRRFGGRSALAAALGVTVSAYGNWKKRGVPFEQCPRIEALVPTVTRQRLRPDDFQDMWPELADARVDGERGRDDLHERSFPIKGNPDYAHFDARRI